MPAIEIPRPEEAAAYAERLRDVVDDFAALGHGSRLRAAFATGITQSNVSAVLNHRVVSPEWLEKLGAWAAAERLSRKV